MSPDSTQQRNPDRKGPVSWWWWWEIGAAILSIISLVLLFVLLSKSNGQALQSWPFPIQLNSLIAVLTTVAKTSMMGPVASCLSQLNWRQFIHRPNPLNQFQVMDDASRGPWGSFMPLIKGLKIRTFLPIALAFVTVVSLSFEPSAQQILGFPERTLILANASAEVGIATEYLSKAFVSAIALVPTPDLFHLQSSIIDGISGTVFEPNFNCPSEYCTWEDFTTLGICSTYQNLTSEIKMNCDDADNPLFNCTYTFPDGKGSTIDRTITFGNLDESLYVRAESFRSWFDSTRVRNGSSVLSAIKVTNYDLYRNRIPGVWAYPEPPVTKSCFARFYWCTQTFRNVTAIPRQLSYRSIDVEELNETDNYIGKGCDFCTTFSSPSTGANFTVDSTLIEVLIDYLSNLLTLEVVNVYPYTPRLNAPVDLANYIYTTDFQNFTINLAKTISNQIRSTNPGDNRNATMHHGTAYTKEIYIHVRWPWAILPTLAVVITYALLTCSIIMNTKHPLFKSSALALLFHGLDHDWVDVHIDHLGNAERIEHATKSMRAQLATHEGDPLLKFRRHGWDIPLLTCVFRSQSQRYFISCQIVGQTRVSRHG